MKGEACRAFFVRFWPGADLGKERRVRPFLAPTGLSPERWLTVG
jgi:hypothetical protein